jgi:hypothetical protein
MTVRVDNAHIHERIHRVAFDKAFLSNLVEAGGSPNGATSIQSNFFPMGQNDQVPYTDVQVECKLK